MKPVIKTGTGMKRSYKSARNKYPPSTNHGIPNKERVCVHVVIFGVLYSNMYVQMLGFYISVIQGS